MQPLQSLPVLKYFEEKVSADEKVIWGRTHIGKGFASRSVSSTHLYSAVNRLNLDMTQFPHLLRLHEAYSKLPAFQDAVPEKQPDAPSS